MSKESFRPGEILTTEYGTTIEGFTVEREGNTQIWYRLYPPNVNRESFNPVTILISSGNYNAVHIYPFGANLTTEEDSRLKPVIYDIIDSSDIRSNGDSRTNGNDGIKFQLRPGTAQNGWVRLSTLGEAIILEPTGFPTAFVIDMNNNSKIKEWKIVDGTKQAVMATLEELQGKEQSLNQRELALERREQEVERLRNALEEIFRLVVKKGDGSIDRELTFENLMDAFRKYKDRALDVEESAFLLAMEEVRLEGEREKLMQQMEKISKRIDQLTRLESLPRARVESRLIKLLWYTVMLIVGIPLEVPIPSLVQQLRPKIGEALLGDNELQLKEVALVLASVINGLIESLDSTMNTQIV